MYNRLIDEHDLYASFVFSEEWKSRLKEIRELSPEAADAVQQYGIGERLSDNGQYNFESGQLLDDMPEDIRGSEAIEGAYQSICDLAEAYARFIVGFALDLQSEAKESSAL
jgi:hypothetical protein